MNCSQVCWWVLLPALALCVGCGGAAVERVPVSGTVTLDGAPLRYGSILFTGAQGPRAGGIVRDGRFSLDEEQGPVLGELRVEIRAPKLAADKPLPTDVGELTRLAMHAEELLPARYNSNSGLKVTTSRDAENFFSFELNSRDKE